MMRLRALVAGLLLAGLLWTAGRPVGPVPPLRALVDPWVGAWRLSAGAPSADRVAVDIPGLDAPVEVVVDDRGVPHVFATTEADAWRAQGWLVARDRLFQLNLQTRATAGRLTEWVGAVALPADRRSRALGLARDAERQWAALAPDDPTRLAMNAYAEGVNAWIASVRTADLPLEFRLLGVLPDRWEPQHGLYLFQQMATVLAFSDAHGARARVASLVGWEAAEALVPVHSPLQEPIQPNGQFAPRLDPLRLPAPSAPDSGARVIAALLDGLPTDRQAERTAAGDALGSNNWAVAPRRTAAGRALLAGDPHLALTLPSIWYEIHLNVPGVLDVAGAALPGAPGVIIGFNRSLAWSVTNTGGDVLDYYRETVDDPAAPRQYQLDGAWQALTLEEEVYRDKGGAVVATDTLRFNHRGPVTLTDGAWISMRWTPQEVVADPHPWIRLNRSHDVEAGMAAIATFVGPTQNFVMADSAGHIGIRSTGYYPLRPGDGRGDLVRDGSLRANDWTGWLPVAQYPTGRDPIQGFLASANQEPVDPRESSAYLGADWPSPWRAIRINTLLRADSQVTPAAMQRFQTDPGSAAADRFVEQFLRAAAAVLATDSSRTTLVRAARLLGEWDRRYTLDNRRAVLFESALGALGRLTWDELIPAGDSVPAVNPSQEILAALLDQPDNSWWDDRRTPVLEDRDATLGRALEVGLERAIARYGEPEGNGWTWSAIRRMQVRHLLGLPALSRRDLALASGTGTLNPSSTGGNHGASWRMVVELGPEVRSWTTYPGGQSGNPLGAGYTDRLAQWTAGDLGEARFPRSAMELPPERVSGAVSMSPGGRR